MKIYIENNKLTGGPSVFKYRLINSFKNKIKTTHNINEDFDCELAFIDVSKKHNKPILLRIDGCYTHEHNKNRNKNIIESIKKSKAIIYQSNFSKEMYEKYLKINKENSVILNGIDYNYTNSVSEDYSVEPGSFVAVANWRDGKRPMSTIKGFLEASTGTKLYVIGNIENKIKDKNIVYLGNIKEDRVISVLKRTDYMIHLCHLDSCPNSVVEAIACNNNVLCTNLGGTKEIVKDNGYVLDVDSWDFTAMKKDYYDNLCPKIVAEGIYNLLKIKKDFTRDDLDIDKVSDKYISYIKSTLGK
jgi:glycosyltransferase involved in cell wall biosynthesis